jgi:hypothetical protein
MSYQEFHDFAGAWQAWLTCASIIIGGGWVYLRFIRQEEKFPHIESAAEIKLIGRQGGIWVAEIVAVLENKGKVPHRVATFTFDFNAIHASDVIQTSPQWRGQVDFSHKIAQGSFLPPDTAFFFIGPGVKARYSWIAKVPGEATMLNLHCTFQYMDRQQASHTMETSISLPSVTPESPQTGQN